MTETIVVLDAISEARADELRKLLPDGMVLTHGTARGDDHMREIIADADYAIAGQVGVSGDVLRAARRLKMLHKWGVGVDNIDLETARALGIKVARTTGSNSLAVAEFTLGLMMATMRNIAYASAELREGRWAGGRIPHQPYLLSNKTVGLIGFGAIGQNVARLLTSFGCTVLYNKPKRLDASEEEAHRVTYAALPELLERADVVSLHCPLTPETAGLIDRAALQRMKRTAVLINVARGGIVNEADLLEALKSGEIRGAAMDVYSVEPVPADDPLLPLTNVVATPHLAAGAADIFAKTVLQMFDNFVHVSRGEPVPPRDLVVG